MKTLVDNVLHVILNTVNSTEALQSLWSQPDFIPNLIKKQNPRTPLEHLLYSFHPQILQDVWGCPPELVDSTCDNKLLHINKYLDSIILSRKGINIMNYPPTILQMLDKREEEICHTKAYKKRYRL